MKDRISTYAGRITLTPVPNQPNTYDMVRADEPIQEGTPLNKQTFLTDETAEKYNLTENATPNDVFNKLKSVKVPTTLLATAWTGDDAPYSITLTVEGVTANSNQEILPSLDITVEEVEALQEANILDGGQAENSITLLAFGEKPTIDLPIIVNLRGD